MSAMPSARMSWASFKDLLLAAARHPAMLYYLDNWESMSPDVFNSWAVCAGTVSWRRAAAWRVNRTA